MPSNNAENSTMGGAAPAAGNAIDEDALTRRRTAPRWFWFGLLGVFALAAVQRFLILSDYLANNPLSDSPTVDALTYWWWAGRIAGGQLSDGTPFFSPPLYPYLLGLLRALGGGLKSVYVSQIILDLFTAGLLAHVARRRFGPGVGLLAATLFLAMLEPASDSLRVLNGSLQLLLTVVAWTILSATDCKPSFARSAAAGASLGLLALAFPPAVIGLPVVAIWLWWRGGWRGRAFGRAVLAIAVGAAAISPATIHNYRACEEFIPISAQAGLTFSHGNAPGAKGTYVRKGGVSIQHQVQNFDAMRVYTEATGNEPSWTGADRYFFAQGLRYWRDNPQQAGVLLARKAYWFLTGRNYGDIFRPMLEIEDGLSARLRLAPVHTAWLIPLALAAIGVWILRPGDHLPELLLFMIPLLIVIAFWYSPRYRLPAVPVIVVAGAWTLVQALAAQRRWRWRAVAIVGVVLGVGFGTINHAVGFDTRQRGRPQYHNALGAALANSRRFDEAAEQFRKALALVPGNADYAVDLAKALSARGDPASALSYLRQAVAANPKHAYAHDALGRALSLSRRPDQALEHHRQAVALNQRDPVLHNNLGDALRINGMYEAAASEHQIAITLDRTMAAAYRGLARARRELGDVSGVIEARRALHKLFPGDATIAHRLAWDLATLPGLAREQRAEGEQLARATLASGRSAGRLNTLAAALAALGQFNQAAETQKEAVTLAEEAGHREKAAELSARVGLYERRRPYVQRIRRPNEPTPSRQQNAP